MISAGKYIVILAEYKWHRVFITLSCGSKTAMACENFASRKPYPNHFFPTFQSDVRLRPHLSQPAWEKIEGLKLIPAEQPST
jgi:hypothetical protein